MVDRSKMSKQLVLHEGLRLHAYVDTEGYWTIGVGYNIDGRGWDFIEHVTGRRVAPRDGMTEKVTITEEEAMKVLYADIDRVEKVVRQLLPNYDKLNEVRQRVCVDISFNIGMKALGFKRAIDAITRGNWSQAARELYQSKWAHQVDDGEGGRFGRADRLARMLLTGVDYSQ